MEFGTHYSCHKTWQVKFIPQQAEVAQGVPDRLRTRIFLTFGTTRVVGHQPYAPAAFTPGEIPGTHFQRLSRRQGTWFRREPRKKSPVTPPGIVPGTSQLVAQCLNHYATPGPLDMAGSTEIKGRLYHYLQRREAIRRQVLHICVTETDKLLRT